MKKLLSLALAALMVLTLGVAVSARTANGSWGNVPLYTGGITIDGKADEAYAYGLQIDCKEDYTSAFATDTTAKFSLLHDGKYLYVYAVINSANPLTDYNQKYASAGQAWNTTGCELMIDWSNDAASSADIYKLMGWFNGNIYGDFLASGKESSVVGEYKATVDKTAKTWTAEFKLPFQEGAKTGSEIGLNAMIDSDANMGASNDAKRQICSMIPSVSNHGDKYKNVTLSATEAAVPKKEAPKTAETTTAAKTPDLFAVVLASAALSGVALVVCKKH